MHTAMGTTEQVKLYLRNLAEIGCEVIEDFKAGVVSAASDSEDCFKAIQKGRNGPWIIIFRDGGIVSWEKPPYPQENGSET